MYKPDDFLQSPCRRNVQARRFFAVSLQAECTPILCSVSAGGMPDPAGGMPDDFLQSSCRSNARRFSAVHCPCRQNVRRFSALFFKKISWGTLGRGKGVPGKLQGSLGRSKRLLGRSRGAQGRLKGIPRGSRGSLRASLGTPRTSLGTPWRPQKSSWDALGLPRGPRRNSIEIGVKMEGPEIDVFIAQGSAVKKGDPTKHCARSWKT